MSKQTNDAIYDAHESHARSVANHQTWGHLFPTEKQYTGTVRISFSIYGDIVVLDEQIGISGSPWWFHAINDFAWEASKEMEGGDACEFNITVDIVTHREADECNDPDFPEDDNFEEYQTIEISADSKKYLIKAY